jgi:hypothetical protein
MRVVKESDFVDLSSEAVVYIKIPGVINQATISLETQRSPDLWGTS